MIVARLGQEDAQRAIEESLTVSTSRVCMSLLFMHLICLTWQTSNQSHRFGSYAPLVPWAG
jgi:hypothetical protein